MIAISVTMLVFALFCVALIFDGAWFTILLLALGTAFGGIKVHNGSAALERIFGAPTEQSSPASDAFKPAD